jgi:hypothetical protein
MQTNQQVGRIETSVEEGDVESRYCSRERWRKFPHLKQRKIGKKETPAVVILRRISGQTTLHVHTVCVVYSPFRIDKIK